MKCYCDKRRHTLSGRLLILFVVVGALSVVILAGTLGWAFRGHFEERIRPHLELYLEYIQTELGDPPDPSKAAQLAKRLQIEITYQGPKPWSTGNHPVTLDNASYLRRFEDKGIEYGLGHDDNYEYLISRHPQYTLIFSQPRQQHDGYMVVVVVVILVILLLLYYAIRRLFAPIETIRLGIERIGGGELDYRLNINRRDELGALAESINTMADDIQKMLDAKRQLLLAISHELRTPLTRAKVSTEMIDDTTQRDELHRELNEVETLIEELLETERLSHRHSALNKAPTDVPTLIEELTGDRADSQDLSLQLPDDKVVINIDAARIKLMLKNLVDNALQHNPTDAKPVQITLKRDGENLVLTVRDHGQGIEPEHLPHLTEPFYRADPARRRQTGGYGLGLYLCRVIAEAHGGTLVIDSEVGSGTEVTVTLPFRAD